MKKHLRLLLIMVIILIFGISFIVVKNYNKSEVFSEEDSKVEKKKSYSNGIAMMLETGSGTGIYEMTTQDSWPTNGYKFNEELSKCENGGELSWDDTNKRVLMSSNMSDKCYVYFDFQKIITFTLEGTQYQAEEGMMWEEWLKSEYNTFYRNTNLSIGFSKKCDTFIGKINENQQYYFCLHNELEGDFSEYYSLTMLTEKEFNDLNLEELITRNEIKLLFDFTEANIKNNAPNLIEYSEYISYFPFFLEATNGGLRNDDGNYEIRICCKDGVSNEIKILIYDLENKEFKIIEPYNIDINNKLLSFIYENDPIIYSILYKE